MAERTNVPVETERKYLIRYPDTNMLAALPGARVLRLCQTYLLSPGDVGVRVRRVEEAGTVRYIRTEKRRISTLSAYETETELTEAQYLDALREADPDRRPVEKIRYVIPHGELFCEVDVYPFWEDRAILEIELPGEDTAVTLPPYLTVIREVSSDGRYKNRALAKKLPDEPLPR